MSAPAAQVHLVAVRVPATGPDGRDAADGVSREATRDALREQEHPNWTLLDPAGADSRTRPRPAPGLAPLPADVPVPENGAGLVAVLPVRDGDRLHPTLFTQVAQALADGARLVSWDAELSASAGAEPACPVRPGWCPDQLLSVDYLEGSFALRLEDYRRAAVLAAGPAGSPPLCTWSLLLALRELGLPEGGAVHLPQVLATGPARPAVADDLAAAVLDAALAGRGRPVRATRVAGRTRLHWQHGRPGGPAWPSVSIVVPTRHDETMMGPLLDSLAATTGPAFDVLVVDNGERTAENEEFYRRDRGFPLRVSWWQETPFHYGRVNNAAARQVDGEVLVLLNDDTRVLDPGWLAELVGLVGEPGVGSAGMLLLDGEDRVQHAGIWLGLGGYAGHLFAGLQPGEATLLGPAERYRTVLACTAACVAVRRSTFLQLGGLDEDLVLAGSDVTLGLDLAELGLRTVVSPLAGVRHLESVTRGSAPAGDQRVSLLRYQPWHDAGDPYLSPRLSLRRRRPTLREPGEADPVAAERQRLGVAL